MVSFLAVDAANNTAECNFEITVVDAEKPVEDEALGDVGRSAWRGPGAFTRLDAFDGVRRRRLFERALNFWDAVRGRVLLLALAV